MTSPTQVLKSVGPKLVPFFKTIAIYFVLVNQETNPSWIAMVLKCLPIISLIIFVLLHGMSLGEEYAYSRKIIAGLWFSCIGDACLIWPEYFIFGMLAFAIGHLNYISAFGFEPLNVSLGVGVYIFGVLACGYVLPGLNGVLLIGVPLYTVILMTTVWRGTARVQFFGDLWTWTKLCSCAGAISFAISDLLISIDRFVSPVAYSQMLIMTTYYAAQLGIALSVVDSKDTYFKNRKDLKDATKVN